MRLIADSGSTKTTWMADDVMLTTQGINPYHQNADQICMILNSELLPQLHDKAAVTEVSFYGAGCNESMVPCMTEVLRNVLGADVEVEVGSDMLGAARALCQHNEGIASILGTGANSCLYDGAQIVANVSPLGYILGDEGSAAYIGKRLVGDVLKHQLSETTCRLFADETQLDAPAIINKVYREPMPNRFLGEVSRFCSRHRNADDIHGLLTDCFIQFFVRNVAYYRRPDLPVHFVGSIAWAYEAELCEAANSCGMTVGTIVRQPIQGLAEFHNSSC